MDILGFLQANWNILLIPVVSGVIGWFTNVVAVKMMLYPTEFVGIPPFLGWQGIIPANALRLAKFSTRLITERLVSLEQLFEGFSADEFTKNASHIVDEMTEQIIQEIATKHAPLMWENAGEVMQGKVREAVREEVRQVAVKITHDLGANITKILDLEKVVVDAVAEDKALMGQMFLEVGSAEFKFIEISGWWFGLLFGVFQMAAWVVYPAWWTLPGAGFVVGYVTNWLALALIFDPKEPTKYGPFVVQGLFHKRQAEVAERFSTMVAGKVLNADNILKTVLQAEPRERIVEIVERHVLELLEKYEQHPMAAMVLPPDQMPVLKAEVLQRVKDEMPKPGGLLHTFAGSAVSIRDQMHERMKALDKESFEGVLRPAFKQDEWKLIVAGAILGLVAGILQLVYMFGYTLA